MNAKARGRVLVASVLVLRLGLVLACQQREKKEQLKNGHVCDWRVLEARRRTRACRRRTNDHGLIGDFFNEASLFLLLDVKVQGMRACCKRSHNQQSQHTTQLHLIHFSLTSFLLLNQ